MPSITYHAVNKQGDFQSNTAPGPNAVTWGVFPGAEVIQPTVVDSTAFQAWKDEAYELGAQWALLYRDGEPETHELIRGIFDEFHLGASSSSPPSRASHSVSLLTVERPRSQSTSSSTTTATRTTTPSSSPSSSSRSRTASAPTARRRLRRRRPTRRQARRLDLNCPYSPRPSRRRIVNRAVVLLVPSPSLLVVSVSPLSVPLCVAFNRALSPAAASSSFVFPSLSSTFPTPCIDFSTSPVPHQLHLPPSHVFLLRLPHLSRLPQTPAARVQPQPSRYPLSRARTSPFLECQLAQTLSRCASREREHEADPAVQGKTTQSTNNNTAVRRGKARASSSSSSSRLCTARPLPLALPPPRSPRDADDTHGALRVDGPDPTGDKRAVVPFPAPPGAVEVLGDGGREDGRPAARVAPDAGDDAKGFGVGRCEG